MLHLHGQYLRIDEDPQGDLLWTLTPLGQEMLAERLGDAPYDGMDYAGIMGDLLEDICCNSTSEWTPDIGNELWNTFALSSAPCFLEDFGVNDDGSFELHGRIWQYTRYIYDLEPAELLAGREVRYVLAGNFDEEADAD